MPGISVATTLYAYAVPVPRPISVNMFGCRAVSELQARWKNGQPQ
jgi:hypothetical protein